MNSLLKKIKPLLIAMFIMAGSAGILTWMTFGVIGLGEELESRIQTIANEQAFEDQFSTLKETVEETAIQRQAMSRFVLDDDSDTIELLSKIDEIAGRQQVELATNQLEVNDSESGNKNYNIVALGYTMSGSEAAVTRMIKIFETLPYHGHVKSLTYRRVLNEETGVVDKVDASIMLSLTIRNHD